MKQRLLVMNGQRIVQTEQGSEWQNQKVDHARALKPGIYNLYMAQAADKSKRHEGTIVHTNDTHVYQQVGKNFIMHTRSDFDKVPEIGNAKSIAYNAEGRAVVAAATLKLGRRHSR
jgi:ABC-type Fe3+/spermidine/putrescine transport system ATPase subunit